MRTLDEINDMLRLAGLPNLTEIVGRKFFFSTDFENYSLAGTIHSVSVWNLQPYLEVCHLKIRMFPVQGFMRKDGKWGVLLKQADGLNTWKEGNLQLL